MASTWRALFTPSSLVAGGVVVVVLALGDRIFEHPVIAYGIVATGFAALIAAFVWAGKRREQPDS